MTLRPSLNGLEQHPHYRRALDVISRLRRLNYVTVLAGGCVRDALLGEVPHDLDIATAAPPEVVEEVFSRTLAVGKAFGTIVVLDGDVQFEVTTFRRDGEYVDGRHPAGVEFSDEREDALRRDFTVNALFFDPEDGEVLDFVGGRDDLNRRLLRAVGDPGLRFREDHLRLLRAPRFVAQLGFALEPITAQAVRDQANLIQSVAAERVGKEMKRLLESRHAGAGLHSLIQTGVSRWIWPELEEVNPHQLEKLMPFLSMEHAVAAVALLAPQFDFEKRLRAWAGSRESLKRVKEQVTSVRNWWTPSLTVVDRARVFSGPDFAIVLSLLEGVYAGESNRIGGEVQNFLKLAGPHGRLPEPLLSGHDLLALGLPPGQKMGQILKQAYEQQLLHGWRDKAVALAWVKSL